MALPIGSQAPDFTLKTKNDEGLSDVSLSEHLGKRPIVLLFFPFAFTGVCQDELCTVSAGLDAYEKVDAAVFGISVDSPFAQEAFAKANKIKVTLLSDFNKTVALSYDVLYPDLIGFQGVAKRSAFVINKEGKVVYSWSTDDPHNLPDFNAVQSALKTC